MRIDGANAALPLVRELVDALPSGSYLAASHFATDHPPAGLLAAGSGDGDGTSRIGAVAADRKP